MSKIYMAVTIKQDRNESIFEPNTNKEYNPGYYSYVVPCKAGENLKFALDCIGGLQVAHLCSTKKRGGGACGSLERRIQGKRGIFV